MQSKDIKPAQGKLGILMPGMGAVATTFMAGVFAARKDQAQPFGSVSQMQTIRVGSGNDRSFPKIKDYVPLANMEDLVFGGWDIFEENMYEAAVNAGVLSPHHLEQVKDDLSAIKPMKAVFSSKFIKNIEGPNIKTGSLADKVAELRQEIKSFKTENNCERLVMIWCGSTEAHSEPSLVHEDIEQFEKAIADDSDDLSPSQLYAYAALKEGVPYINGAPHNTVNVPALSNLAQSSNIPIAGRDFKTGQTLIKTIIAPGLKARMLGLNGWFSTNILGNRDGEVLDSPENFKSKEVTKAGVLDTVLQPDVYPELYKDYYHKVRINYYPPRGDEKEGWDNIDIFGWMGYPMQIKVNFLCRDSILAAPIVLDLVLFTDLAARAGLGGVQDWLSFYFKGPQTSDGSPSEHDLFIQHTMLKNTLRRLMGDDAITHVEEIEEQL